MKEIRDQDNPGGPGKLPRHIAIIMDGNGRWARQRLMPRTMGHRAGMQSLKQAVEFCAENNIPYLTVYAFSTENWKRPREEVSYLMSLLVEYMQKELAELNDNNIRIKAIGQYREFGEIYGREVDQAIATTRENTGLTLTLALNYGARREILETAKNMGKMLMQGEITLDDFNEETFSRNLETFDIPDPDLLIRTAGEERLSNFLLWQLAYTEIWITDVLWPDFSKEHLHRALQDYEKRNRRFGGL